MSIAELLYQLTSTRPQQGKPRVAISACLNGAAVRYDGTDKKLETTLEQLRNSLDLQAVCPEVGAGMGTPRPPVQRVHDPGGRDSVRGRDEPTLDVTEALATYSEQWLQEENQQSKSLCGYILKSRSPSCGWQSTPVFDGKGHILYTANGLHADRVSVSMPRLQLIDECTVEHADNCELFILRCQLLDQIIRCAEHEPLSMLARAYQPLINTLPHELQSSLHTAVSSGDIRLFINSFGRGLQALVTSAAD